MALRVVGAGLGRTGTLSLKVALERLLGSPCYHMLEVFAHTDHVGTWHRAVRREPVDWDVLFDGYEAAVDWPAAAFWRELADAYPDAIVLLSTRDAEGWWRSCERTIFEMFRRDLPPEMQEWHDMLIDMFRATFLDGPPDERSAIEAYERHNADVRATAPAGRLVEWRPGDGWDPLCTALGVPVPGEPFPHVNTTEEFRARAGFDV